LSVRAQVSEPTDLVDELQRRSASALRRGGSSLLATGDAPEPEVLESIAAEVAGSLVSTT
jgi:hypothetical protein